MFYSVVTNALFVCRVDKGVETSVYITEFADTRILDLNSQPLTRPHDSQQLTNLNTEVGRMIRSQKVDNALPRIAHVIRHFVWHTLLCVVV